ncbi:MAG: restriction endonuclease subunit S [Bacteroidales bacterium]|nr:restriction endonuclease subunit S [Bacteroidales bacterium]MCB9012778.1 restriction endonuclease subunit S [Bacteroidales bacterium]
MINQKYIPVLRFPEFSSDFAEKKLGDITKINQGLQIPISERFLEPVENSYFYITNEFIKAGSLKKFYIKNPTDSVLCVEDDILMTRTGNTGQIVTGVNGAFHNNFFKIKYSGEIHKWFLFYFLKLPNTQKVIMQYAGTSTIPDLNHSDFYRISIKLPSLPEQQKIASFLTSVDTKLTQLKQKKNLLEQYKKGVIQKIFSQEIRFKDDEGKEFPEWEKKTLAEVGQTYNGLTGKTKENFGQGKPYIQYKQIFDDSKIDISRFEYVEIGENESHNQVRFGDVFFTVSSETPDEIGTASVLLDHVDELYLNSFCFGYRPNSFEILSPFFARYLFRSEGFRNDIIKLAQGSTRYNMSKVQLMKLTISLPSGSEQTKISNFLSSLDDKINHCSTQIEKTEQWKKGLLQQMFV